MKFFCLSVTLLAGHTVNALMKMLNVPFSSLFNKIISLDFKLFFHYYFSILHTNTLLECFQNYLHSATA